MGKFHPNWSALAYHEFPFRSPELSVQLAFGVSYTAQAERRQPKAPATDRVTTGGSKGPADPIVHKAQRHEGQEPSRRPGSAFLEAGWRLSKPGCWAWPSTLN